MTTDRAGARLLVSPGAVLGIVRRLGRALLRWLDRRRTHDDPHSSA